VLYNLRAKVLREKKTVILLLQWNSVVIKWKARVFPFCFSLKIAIFVNSDVAA